MPWLYLLALSIVILIVWWALSRSAQTNIAPGENLPEQETYEKEIAPADEDKPDDPVE